MPDFTHQKARTLLQTATDQQLDAQEKNLLDSHLSDCKDCSAYANDLFNIENRLRRVMKTHWDKPRPHLNLQTILRPPRAKRIWNNVFSRTNAMGKVTIVTTLLLGYIVLANLFGIQLPVLENKTPTAAPTPNEVKAIFATAPTPYAQFTLTSAQKCEAVNYIVQSPDTLESIALQFGIQKSVIMEHNNLSTENISPEMKLSIPLCKSIPTDLGTITSLTMTITPLNVVTNTYQPE
jgi:LysM repeat protein